MSLRSDFFIRRAQRGDLDTVMEWMDDPDFIHNLYGSPLRSPKRLREDIVSMLGRTTGVAAPGAIYLIIDSLERGAVGMYAIQNISWRNRSCHLDAYVCRELRASAVGAFAFYRACAYCFHELNMRRINVYVYSFNKASWRLVERSGAAREMTVRRHVARDGELHDLYCYGLLRPAFEKLHEEALRRGPELSLEGNKRTYERAMAAREMAP